MKEKNYTIDIDLKFTQVLSAKNKKEAIEQVEVSFYEDYGIDVLPEEMKFVD